MSAIRRPGYSHNVIITSYQTDSLYTYHVMPAIRIPGYSHNVIITAYQTDSLYTYCVMTAVGIPGYSHLTLSSQPIRPILFVLTV